MINIMKLHDDSHIHTLHTYFTNLNAEDRSTSMLKIRNYYVCRLHTHYGCEIRTNKREKQNG